METKEKNREAGKETNRRQTGQTSAPVRRRAESQDGAEPRKKAKTDSAQDGGQRKVKSTAASDSPKQTSAAAKTGATPRRQAPQGAGAAKTDASRTARKRKTDPTSAAEATAKRRQQQKKSGVLGFLSVGGKKKKKRNLTPEERAERRRREEEAAQERKERRQSELPEVIYTQPAPFNRDRFLIHLLSIAAVVVAMILGMSVFFKVKTITVAGAETYSAYAIQQASGISVGDNLLTFSKARAVARIHAEHAYVDDVRIGIKLPDTVIIYIEELDVAYAINSINDGWWLINSDGKVVQQINEKQSYDYTRVVGVALDSPQIGLTGQAAELVPEETLESGDPIPITVTGAQRLSAALQILKELEANDIVGEASSVDVASLEDIVLWYGTQYEVLLGSIDRMDYKIACMNDAILQMSDYQSGTLDVTFTTWINQVGYTPFA